MESLRHEVVCSEHDIARYVPDPPAQSVPGLSRSVRGPIGFDDAVRLALRRIRDDEVVTRTNGLDRSGYGDDGVTAADREDRDPFVGALQVADGSFRRL